uniref:Fibronectin type-III domain-containing protein n=1 Tax=Globodera rostochiensis TaxID=31243 RepID=A0A914H4B6_GLORO
MSTKSCCPNWLNASRFWTFVRDKFLSHHLLLAIACVFYILLGALMFQLLEERHFLESKANHLRRIGEDSEQYAEAVWAEIQENLAKILREGLNEAKMVAKARMATEEKFHKYVDTVYAAHRAVRHGFEENPPTWDFKNSLFFTATMLTSIGYGFVCPSTFEGRLFGVLYCLIGIPLTLVNVANVAKFFSEFIFFFHFKVWEFCGRIRNIGRPSPDLSSPGGASDMFGESEDEESLLDRVRLVRFPPFVAFGMVVVYGFLAAYVVQRYYEVRWTYLDSLYFMFISILTVGFGDYRPQSENMFAVLFLVTCGVIFTTMCMDVVGRMYLKEIHYLGRKLQSNNPFYMIREAKAKRRRAAMASLLAQLAKGMIFAHKNFSELQKKISIRKFSARRRPSHILPDGKFMFARLPPDPPRECQVISTSAYSVRLAWAASFSSEDVKVTYNLRYRQKYEQSSSDVEGEAKRPKMRELKGIQGFAVEIMSLASCSLYEFRITAVSKYGESKPVILVQYTEPQLSPQHLLATKLSGNAVELTWEAPYKRANDVKHYMVYWTDNSESRLSEWQKLSVYGRRVIFPDLKHDWFYLYCANACFNNDQRSPLSRAIFVKTDKMELNKRCIGHSHTVEVMQAIAQREEEASESTPLLKRAKYASFAI